MDTPDEKYNLILGKLRDKKPNLSDPGALTNAIMTSVHKNGESIAAKSIRILRPWLTTAAACMIGFYFFQNNNVQIPESLETIKTRHTKNSSLLQCFERNNTIEVNLFDSYRCYLKETELKKQRSKDFQVKMRNYFR